MKKIQNPRCITIILIAIFSISLSNCAVGIGTRSTNSKSKALPPGQAKKITGAKSAKRYAPGQNK
ncbi:hypothetical protein AAGV33_14095 [Flavobacterium sp. FBOR7N2.3]|uniref:Quinol oxidase subunit 4 n=1 Tax=Flavobacterium magnesitis TaxID=3138077 RepID=A0ABV4TN78_9FLAO